MPWVAIATALASAGAGVYASNEASSAAQRGSRQATQLQRDALNASLRAGEPQRALGYQAMGDLSALYGYSQAPYSPLSELMGGGGSGGGQTLYAKEIKQLLKSGVTPEQIDQMGSLGDLNRQGARRLGRYVNRYVKKNDLNALAEQYGVTLTGRKKKDRRAVTGAIVASLYDDSDEGPSPADYTPSTQPTAGNMDRFFTSPDYQFRLSEGIRANDQSAAARGGAFSGDAIRANTEYGSNLAAGEYNNYVSRLMQLAGFGAQQTQQAQSSLLNFGNQAATNASNAANARASGIMGMGNSIMGGINSGLQGYYLNRYLNTMGNNTGNG